MIASSLTWVEISESKFNHNIAQYKNIVAPSTVLAPVIKANAYGHDMKLIGQLCQKNSNVDWMCTVNLSEALALRDQGITKPILTLSYLDAPIEEAILNDIDFVVSSTDLIKKVAHAATALQKSAKIHLKVDTGLSRLGIPPDQVVHVVKNIACNPGLFLDGIFMHFADSESDNHTFALKQLERFNAVLAQLKDNGIHIPYQHSSCSAAAITVPSCHYNFVRFGVSAYGLWSSPETKEKAHQLHPAFTLQPLLTWKTRIVQIKTVPAFSYVGYDRTHQTKRETITAIIPIGYWEGYDRQLSNKAVVRIRDQYAPVIGRISMNVSIIDITDIPGVQYHDEVILLGDYPGLRSDDHATMTETINYEVVTKINPLIKRILVA